MCVCTPGCGEEGANPLPLFPRLSSWALAWSTSHGPALDSPPCWAGAGRLDKLPSPDPWGIVPSGSRSLSLLFSLAFAYP